MIVVLGHKELSCICMQPQHMHVHVNYGCLLTLGMHAQESYCSRLCLSVKLHLMYIWSVCYS